MTHDINISIRPDHTGIAARAVQHHHELRVATASDADDHARNLSRWNQEYDQFSAGVFSGRITELWLTKTQLFLESTNQVLHQSCAAWPGSLWFGIPIPNGQQAAMGSNQIPDVSVAVKRGGTEFKLVTPANFNILGIVIDEDTFAQYVQEVEHLDCYGLLGLREVLAVDLRAKREVCEALLRILSGTDAAPDRPALSLSPEMLQDRILMNLVPLLLTATSKEQRISSTLLNRERIVHEVRAYILENPGEDISIPDLCRRFHVSRRTLQYCFEEVVGMSPLNFLRTVRLNAVRRELFFKCQLGQVTEVAMSWGFRHLSQFASDYRKLFGMLPSDTLRASAANGHNVYR
ncbi:helix-turn-helix domain-containing protein [Noviherbaspirillum saxi]|uniref:Helix-turn-helix domain-containing protein n=1 Tax=Noviherbaspirillum saxi TaxID=2320863 RepID=A0A3A3FFP4_9BURK|nr:helix-turn-helix domain-containing protein [Noviherbaspirillum saxi]RJF92070.1 helix-turn-helix domain-containing protein [Noviherbaspirillum saxi]